MRQWMKLFESQVLIDLVENYGSAEGYVTDDPSIISNWFMHRHDVYEPSLVEMVLDYDCIAFLNNINVNEDARGHGHGGDLLAMFEDRAAREGAQAILLFADINESQTEGFDLEQWYLRNGYEEVKPHEGLFYCPLMMKVF